VPAAAASWPAGVLLLLTPNVNPAEPAVVGGDAPAAAAAAAAPAGVNPKPLPLLPPAAGVGALLPNVKPPVEGEGPGVMLAAPPTLPGVTEPPSLNGSGEGSSPAFAAGVAAGVAPKLKPKPLAGAGVWPAFAMLEVPGAPGVAEPAALPKPGVDAAAKPPAASNFGCSAKVTDLRPPPPPKPVKRPVAAPAASAAAAAGPLAAGAGVPKRLLASGELLRC
jgi:hypothetical protein